MPRLDAHGVLHHVMAGELTEERYFGVTGTAKIL